MLQHLDARDKAAPYVAALLDVLAAAKGCRPDDLSAPDIAFVENLALALVREGYELAHEEITVPRMRTIPYFEPPKR